MPAEIANRLISDLMSDFGLSRQQAAGVAGNFAHETLNFTRMQETGVARGGLGYAQWTGARRTRFENWAAERGLDTGTYEANYGYLRHEIATDPYERRQFMRVTGASTPAEAAQIVSDQFLRPRTPHIDRRIDLANQFAGPAAPRVAPIPATPSLPVQSARLGAGATNQDLQAALNARVNAPPMPRQRPERANSPLGAIESVAPRQIPNSGFSYADRRPPMPSQNLTQPGAIDQSVKSAGAARDTALAAALASRPAAPTASDRTRGNPYQGQGATSSVVASIPTTGIGQPPRERFVQSVPVPTRPSVPQTRVPAPRTNIAGFSGPAGVPAPLSGKAPAPTTTARPAAMTASDRVRQTQVPVSQDRLPSGFAYPASVGPGLTPAQVAQIGVPMQGPPMPRQTMVAQAPKVAPVPMPPRMGVATQLATVAPPVAPVARPVAPTAVAPIPRPRPLPATVNPMTSFLQDLQLPNFFQGSASSAQSQPVAPQSGSGTIAPTHRAGNYNYVSDGAGGYINVGRANGTRSGESARDKIERAGIGSGLL